MIMPDLQREKVDPRILHRSGTASSGEFVVHATVDYSDGERSGNWRYCVFAREKLFVADGSYLAYAEQMMQLVHVGLGSGEFDDVEQVATRALQRFINDNCSCKSLNGVAHLPTCTINEV
jgi:hypothetical protein